MPAAVPVVLVVAGILVLVATIVASSRLNRMRRNTFTVPPGWLRADGTVTDVVSESTPSIRNSSMPLATGMGGVQRPVIDFVAADGTRVRFTSASAAGSMPGRGSPVVVYHSPDDPRRAMLGPESQPAVNRATLGAARGILTGVGVVVGVVVTGVGVLLLALG